MKLRISRSCNIILCCLMFSLSDISMATEYYSIKDVGATYNDNHQRPSQFIVESWGRFISPSVKKYLLSLNNSPYYHPTNGDVGMLVADLGLNENKLILDVDGNAVIIQKGAVTKVDQSAYDAFVSSINSAASETFGFKLGLTTPEEAVNILKRNGAKYDDHLWYRGSVQLPIIRIYEYKYLPVINGNAADAILWFVDNKLYQIQLILSESKQGRETWLTIVNGLVSKYNREPRTGDVFQYWLNPDRHISQSENETRDVIHLKYNDTNLLIKADTLKEYFDQKIKEEDRVKKLEEAKSQL